MLGFPVPYTDELIYSTVARAGIHLGIQSPKELLDEVFENRKVIATPDLPCHLQTIANLYPISLKLDVEGLAYKHTLFPIYAPFITEQRRINGLLWMKGFSQGSVHLALGVAASRVKQLLNFRYCPKCLEKQLSELGEFYWLRQWQVAGADCCLEHGRLLTASVELHNYHRHEFFPATSNNCPLEAQNESSWQSKVVTEKVKLLLQLTPQCSPSFNQWTSYYKWLAQLNDCTRAQQINYYAIKQRVGSHWGEEWLNRQGLSVHDKQSCWLRAIFRKHRKSFSYLEHIVALDSFLPEKWQFQDVIKAVVAFPEEFKASPKEPLQGARDGRLVLNYRVNWLHRLNNHGPKLARIGDGGAIYAWLYRHDRYWLLDTNKHHRQAKKTINHRVNWIKRDRNIVRQLCNIRDQYEMVLGSPRHSRCWYLSKIKQTSSVEKKLSKLPLTQMFFYRFCESVEDYQIRRITNVVIIILSDKQNLKRWKLLRMSGLNETRLTKQAKQFLAIILREYG